VTDYTYVDRDDDTLSIRSCDPIGAGPVASVCIAEGETVWVTAEEAPKAAQAILDAAGVEAVIVTGELPEVTETSGGNLCEVNGHTCLIDPVYYDKALRELLAVKAYAEARESRREAQLAEVRKDADRLLAERDAAKKAHDELRTSPIALKALTLYNEDYADILRGNNYESWDAVNAGYGAEDDTVRYRIKEAEEVERQEAERLTARRNALLKDELRSQFTYEELREGSPICRAVDRIIELEDGEAR
jgi:hypothetical protein